MTDPIKAGDLVQVVRGCGCWSGFTEVVDAVSTPDLIGLVCEACGWKGKTAVAMMANHGPGKLLYVPLSWLQKIPPLSDRESLDAIMEAPQPRVPESA